MLPTICVVSIAIRLAIRITGVAGLRRPRFESWPRAQDAEHWLVGGSAGAGGVDQVVGRLDRRAELKVSRAAETLNGPMLGSPVGVIEKLPSIPFSTSARSTASTTPPDPGSADHLQQELGACPSYDAYNSTGASSSPVESSSTKVFPGPVRLSSVWPENTHEHPGRGVARVIDRRLLGEPIRRKAGPRLLHPRSARAPRPCPILMITGPFSSSSARIRPSVAHVRAGPSPSARCSRRPPGPRARSQPSPELQRLRRPVEDVPLALRWSDSRWRRG